MRNKFLLALLVLAMLGAPGTVQAQTGVEVTSIQITYQFGEQITFRGRVVTSAPIQEVFVSFRQEGEQGARVFPMELDPSGQVTYTHRIVQDVLRPFARISFWYEVHLGTGETFTSSPYLFRYADNRFDWKSAGESPIKVYWYEGSPAFGQAALEAASAGLEVAKEVVPLSQSASVEVYIYASPVDLQGALALGGEDWQAGHASPDLGVVMVAIPPGPSQALQMDQLIPHELAHVVLYQGLGRDYANLPVWFSEGVASLAERFPNPEYERALSLASQENSLLPLADLCTTFPSDQARAFLAYAEADSFTRYLRERHGNMGLSALAIAYTDELDCEQGAERGLGKPLSQLEREWREEALGENLAGVAARNLLPYNLALGIILAVPVAGMLSAMLRRKKNGYK